MQAYVIRRVLALVPTMIFASLIVFITVRLIPGDVIDLALFAAQQASGQSLQVLAELGILERLHAIPVPPTYENTL